MAVCTNFKKNFSSKIINKIIISKKSAFIMKSWNIYEMEEHHAAHCIHAGNLCNITLKDVGAIVATH